MDDTIYRQAAIKEVHGAIYEFFDFCDDDEESPMTYKDEKLLELNKAITLRIKQLPSVQSERKNGKWVKQNPLVDTEECSVCGYNIISEELETPFCPWCGADMRAE